MNIELTSRLSVDSDLIKQEKPPAGSAVLNSAPTEVSQPIQHQAVQRQEAGQVKRSQPDSIKEIERKELAEVLEELNQAIPLRARQLEFSLNEEANRTVISVLDKESGDVIRQIPNEEALELAARLRELNQDGQEQTVGVLVNREI